jgi:hypothetical protein
MVLARGAFEENGNRMVNGFAGPRRLTVARGVCPGAFPALITS